ncbi:MAG: hypothetical protein QGG42_12070 [Phycisphaerae bacterium]|jgi:hypothetical protein|nr:hypothetical protein [Phycisphaerae bacterium]
MWKLFESIIVLVAIGIAAALLACRAKKTLTGKDGCGCGKSNSCTLTSLDALSSDDSSEEGDDEEEFDEGG